MFKICAIVIEQDALVQGFNCLLDLSYTELLGHTPRDHVVCCKPAFCVSNKAQCRVNHFCFICKLWIIIHLLSCSKYFWYVIVLLSAIILQWYQIIWVTLTYISEHAHRSSILFRHQQFNIRFLSIPPINFPNHNFPALWVSNNFLWYAAKHSPRHKWTGCPFESKQPFQTILVFFVQPSHLHYRRFLSPRLSW